MKIKTLALALSLAGSVASVAYADDMKTAKLDNGDLMLVEKIHHVNQMEIDLGKLAQANGTAAVKSYAQMMVKDHTAADKDIATFAKKHGTATIPKAMAMTEADKAKDKDMADQAAALKKLKGSEFDRKYVQMMVDGHTGVLADLKAATPSDPELKTMIETAVIPTVQTHANKATELKAAQPKS